MLDTLRLNFFEAAISRFLAQLFPILEPLCLGNSSLALEKQSTNI